LCPFNTDFRKYANLRVYNSLDIDRDVIFCILSFRSVGDIKSSSQHYGSIDMVEILNHGTWGNDRAAAYLGCTPYTMRVWVSKRKVPFLKVGRLTRFRRSDLDAWLDERLVVPEK
jgi:excisionase family DNA binding protein